MIYVDAVLLVPPHMLFAPLNEPFSLPSSSLSTLLNASTRSLLSDRRDLSEGRTYDPVSFTASSSESPAYSSVYSPILALYSIGTLATRKEDGAVRSRVVLNLPGF